MLDLDPEIKVFNKFKGCISSQQELVRMGEMIAYKDQDGLVSKEYCNWVKNKPFSIPQFTIFELSFYLFKPFSGELRRVWWCHKIG